MADGGAYELKPWNDVAVPHADVRSGDLSMGTYAANLAAVALGSGDDQPLVYSDAREFFASTYFTEAMVRMIDSTWKALAGKPVDRVVQLRTPFGGGKTHALLAHYHLARNPGVADEVPELAGIEGVGEVRVAVLSGEYLDPMRGREVGGRTIMTLWGELAYQLGGWEAYESLLVDGSEGTPPAGEGLTKLLAGAPTLILLDEALIYMVKGKAVPMGDSDMARQALVFIMHLTEAVNATQESAFVYSLQASVGEAIQEEGLLRDLEHLVGRIDTRREPVTGDEVLKVVQRRLFESIGDEEVRHQVARAYAQLHQEEREAAAETEEDRRDAVDSARTLEERIKASYPFHPELVDVMNHRWGSLPDYQRTRGALQFLATVIHALWSGGGDARVGPLIGAGDVDLRDDLVRGVFLEQVGAEKDYRSVIEADFIDADAGTRKVDRQLGREAPAIANLRVGTRVATAVMLMSFGGGEGEERGAIEREVVDTALVPGLDGNLIRSALRSLRGKPDLNLALLYLHERERRYRFRPEPNLNRLIVAEQDKLTGEEVTDRVREAFERGLGTGARQQAVVWAKTPEEVEDKVPRFRVVYLHPEWERNGATLDAFIVAGQRRFKNALALAVPAGSAFDRARGSSRASLAVSRLLAAKSKHQFTPEQIEELTEHKAAADRELAATVTDSYERVLLPSAIAGEDVTFDEISLSTVLGAGRGLHERVRDGLQNHVFETLKATRLRTITKLDERGAVKCDGLVESLCSYLGMPRFWDPETPVTEAVSQGVAGGLLGYCSQVEIAADGAISVADPSLIRLKVELPVDEIDLGPGAALLSAATASELLPKPEDGDGGDDGTKQSDDGDAGEGPEPEPRPGPVGNTRVELSVTATEDDLHTLQLALSGLRDLTDEVRITLQAAAKANKPIDKVKFQNTVRQHLEEDEDVSFEERWD